MAVLTLTSTNASASVDPRFRGKGTILPFAAATDEEALAARVDPYRVVATCYLLLPVSGRAPAGGTMAGSEFDVVYEARSGPKGVITAYPSDIA